jgi:hypothetical protein
MMGVQPGGGGISAHVTPKEIVGIIDGISKIIFFFHM